VYRTGWVTRRAATHEVFRNPHHTFVEFQFLFDHLTEHANAKVVVVTESLGKALANLIGNDGRSDQLGVSVLQAGSRVGP
jgi:hypothetical protein